MKNLFYIFVILTTTIVFTSCDGRKSQRKILSESVEKFNKTNTFEYNVFKPISLLETTVDSMLQNGYRVKIKTYTDTKNSVVITSTNDNRKQKTSYRNYKFDITVEKQGKLIFNDSFDKLKANKLFDFKTNLDKTSRLHDFYKSSVLQYIALRDEPSSKNKILIDVVYAIPETDRYIEKTILIKDDGTINSINSNTD